MQRWFAFYDSNAENRTTRWSKFGILLYALHQEGKLPDIQSFSMFANEARCRGIRLVKPLAAKPKVLAKAKAKAKSKKGKGAEAAAAPQPTCDMAAAEVTSEQPSGNDNIVGGQTAKEDDNKTQGQDKKVKEMLSSMEAAAIALSSERNSLGMDVIHYMVAPIRQFYSHIQESVRGGPHQVRNFFAGLAVGQMHCASVEIWMQLRSAEVLSTCGIVLERNLTSEDEVLEGEVLVMEQSSIAALLDNCALSLIAERCDEAITHEHDYISRCAGLLHPDEWQRQQTLADLKRQAHSFRRATREIGSPAIQSIVSRSSFNGSVEKAFYFLLLLFTLNNNIQFVFAVSRLSGAGEPLATGRVSNCSSHCRKHHI